MNCNSFIDSISDYFDNSLSSSELEEFNQHLQNCQSCNTHFQQFSDMLHSLKTLPDVSTPDNLKSNVMKKITSIHLQNSQKNKYKLPKFYYLAASFALLLVGVIFFKDSLIKNPDVAPLSIASNDNSDLSENPNLRTTFNEDIKIFDIDIVTDDILKLKEFLMNNFRQVSFFSGDEYFELIFDSEEFPVIEKALSDVSDFYIYFSNLNEVSDYIKEVEYVDVKLCANIIKK